MDTPLKVTVVVPCRNEAGSIGKLLESLERQDTTGLDLEILIADGMSDDGTRDILRRAEGRVRVIDNPGRIVSTGLNAAIRASRGDIIVRMDAHTEYAPDYVRRSVETLIATGADNVGGAPRVKAAGFRSNALALAYHSPFAVGGARSHDPWYEGPVDSVFYGCWRKATLLSVGLFDEGLVRNQDDELNLRICREGGTVWQSRRIVCWYTPRSTLRGLWRQQLQYGFWKVAVIRKHRLPASWRHLVPGLFVLALAALPLMWALASAAGSRRAASAAGAAWALLLAAYGLCSATAAVVAASAGGWAAAPLLPLIFATYHVAYGSGFLWGVVFWSVRRGQRPAGQYLTALTRETRNGA